MTTDEKRKVLHTYCGSTDCYNCVLRVGDWYRKCELLNCLDISISPDKDLDRALSLIGHSVENDTVNKPAHYTDGKIEVIDFIEDKKLGFCLGNAIKYISRAGKKDPTKEVEDLKKAAWYINRRIKELEEKIC